MRLIFYLFLIAIVTAGSFIIGPLSIRVYMTIIMALLLTWKIFLQKQKLLLSYKEIKLYVCFIIAMVMAQSLNNEISSSDLPKNIFAYHFVSIIVFFAIDSFVTNKTILKNVTLILLFIVIIDSISTYLQYINHPLGWNLSQLLFTVENVKIDRATEYIENYEITNLSGVSLAVGIFGDSVINGYILASLGMLPFYYIFNINYSTKIKTAGWLAYLVCVGGCFMTQQRTAFILLMLGSLYFFIYHIPRWKTLLFLIILMIWITFFSNLLTNMDWGRYSNLTLGENRIYIYTNALSYIQDHWFLGGPVGFNNLYKVFPHNFILNAFIYAGLIGAFFALWLFIKIISQSIRLLFKNIKHISYSVIYACALTIYLLIGFTHNASLITGDCNIWLLFGLMLRALQLGK